MSTGRKTARDLVEEAKKRAVLLLVCVFGLSYLMSLTSSSVWVNLPAAATLILVGRYISLDMDVRRRAAASNNTLVDQSPPKRLLELNKFPCKKSNWRRKVNSPPVEAAIDQFTRHLISEWVTDLWYSRITPDKDGPEELVQTMNNVLAEISHRAREINLINLLTRDIINLVCNHLELYRISQSKIQKHELGKLSIDNQDTQLRLVLAADNKLHPALFSAEAEHKVLQHLVNALILITFTADDLQCSFFRYTVRELLACAVFRPVVNLANPRVINEKIESLVISLANKSNKGATPTTEEKPVLMPLQKPSADQLQGFQDRSTIGVELVQVRHNQSKTVPDGQIRSTRGMSFHKDINNSRSAERNESGNPGGEWAQMLDAISRRKTQVLAPENLENLWTKGRNYKKKESAGQVGNMVGQKVVRDVSGRNGDTSHDCAVVSNYLIQETGVTVDASKSTNFNGSNHHQVTSYQERTQHVNHEEVESDSESSYQTDDDENNNVMGLDTPGTKVWDSKNKINASTHIRHPLETSDFHIAKKNGKGNVRHPRTMRTLSARKRSRSSKMKVPIWQEVERKSFLFGEEQDLLHGSKTDSRTEGLSDDPELEFWGRIHSGAAASSSQSSISTSESSISSLKSPENSVLADTFLKLRCEVLGANTVKSGSGTFAVYSIAVTDANSNSWSIKRRYRHFEELHRRLKEFPEYNLSLPPKHFLSSGLDVFVVQERCKLLDKYLKVLLQIPNVSGSIEVWDFLSVDSQTYMFSDSLSVIQTFSVNLDDKSRDRSLKGHHAVENTNSQPLPGCENLNSVNKEYPVQMNESHSESHNQGLSKRNMEQSSGNSRKEMKNTYQDASRIDSEYRHQETVLTSSKPKIVGAQGADILQETSPTIETDDDSAIPTEWVPPNLSVPIFNLVDVVFQLQDGGWIRRKAFWIAKQLLQLGMGDAFDDWLIDKIQLLRRGSVIASAINRVEQILWPDGIFLTKHPNRKRPTPVPSLGSQKDSKMENLLTPEEQVEAARRAKFVYELMIDKAPAALISLFGRKEYEHCAQDLYFFLQSPLCLKQLAFELLELILLSAFPELDDAVRQCHEEKEKFGVFEHDR
ncbi:uncharacterized protein M6B38_371730 [Iris pallida]|uniref:Uncharacterized protein n=1 Tax=Iris pallida TaxID=29817 RepID=A0AAX6GD88_IRIPA|nr:uncharacterized protein M6B38_371730 [Iris pallida]